MLRIALPNKGRLAATARTLLARAGLDLDLTSERALQAPLGAEFTALFVRARDIPEFVADGAADLGITGADLVAESGRAVETRLDLGFGRCRLMLAVREEEPAATVDALPPGLRIATPFPRIATGWLAGALRTTTVVPVSGAAEIAPSLGVADAVIDLVSSGSTLRVNGLRPLATILESSARLIVRPDVRSRPDDARQADELATALESVVRAEDRRYLMANVPKESLEAVRRILPGISGPTIVNVLNSGRHVAAHAVVPRRDLYRVIAELKGVGAEGILVLGIERLMP